ncbi:MAG: undecaprenyl-diphosphate phosphatase [Candidatus Aminicenantes bacterium]|nr:undecaprenyl-diphosphate phosphatase [Candidatus Aminicenantes bacterium]
MTLLQACLLAILQGLTEFFPVSSSGHLVLLQRLFGFQEPQILFDTLLHTGTALALIVYLRRELFQMILALVRLGQKKAHPEDKEARQLLGHLFIATLPIIIIGYLGADFFESLFVSLKTVGLALIGTAIFLFLTKNTHPQQARETSSQAILIGLLQAAAIVPGLSRSGLTIGGGLYLGLPRERAARFSYLLSLPAIIGASLYQLLKQGSLTEKHQIYIYLLGLIIATGVGYFALVFLTKLVRGGKFYLFSIYCFLLGGLVFLSTIW